MSLAAPQDSRLEEVGFREDENPQAASIVFTVQEPILS